ncbi:MAG: ABC transporter permease [Sphaerochaetaceae bacterium]
MNIKESTHTFFRYSNLLHELVRRDIKLKYRRSFLGYLWSVLNPLMVMLVMTAIFSRLFRFDIPNYPVYLLTGQVIFSFHSEASNFSIGSITGGGALLKKVYLPKYIFTLSKVMSSLVNLVFSLGALLLVMLITRTPFTWKILLFPLVILQIFLFEVGLGMFLAQAAVFFRDIQYIWGVVLTLWTYSTPIFYPDSTLGTGRVAWIVRNLNPLYSYMTQFRDYVLYGQIPSAHLVLLGCGWSLFFLILGAATFYKAQDKFILYI